MDLAIEIKKERETDELDYCQEIPQPQTVYIKTEVNECEPIPPLKSEPSDENGQIDMNVLSKIKQEILKYDDIDQERVENITLDIDNIRKELDLPNEEQMIDDSLDRNNSRMEVGFQYCKAEEEEESMVLEPEPNILCRVEINSEARSEGITKELEVGYDNAEQAIGNLLCTAKRIAEMQSLDEKEEESKTIGLDQNMLCQVEINDDPQQTAKPPERRKIEPRVFYTFRDIDNKQVHTILGDAEDDNAKILDKEMSKADIRFGSHFLSTEKRRTTRFEFDEERKVYKCLHCIYETKGKSTFSAHFNRIHKINQKLYQCPDCEYSTKERSHMMRHIKIKHDEYSKILYCEYCSYKTKDRNGLNQHFRTKHDICPEELKCEVCGYTTKTRASLKQHMKRQHDKSIEIIKCEYCPYKAKRQIDWLRHFRRKHDTISEILKCNLCDYTTRQKLDLTSHFKRKHDDNIKYFYCDKCQFKAKSNADVMRHKKLRHEENVEYFQCLYCDFSTKLKTSLTTHCRRKHGFTSSLKCPFCEYETKDSSELSKHFDEAHQNEESSSCE